MDGGSCREVWRQILEQAPVLAVSADGPAGLAGGFEILRAVKCALDAPLKRIAGVSYARRGGVVVLGAGRRCRDFGAVKCAQNAPRCSVW